MTDNDQTARMYDGRYRGKKVLVIGSGSDLDGRKLGELIDGDYYDVVARVNKHYGSVEDVGNRTDVIITRWTSWLDNYDWFSPDEQSKASDIVILNQHVGYSQSEYQWLTVQVGHQQVSAGAQAISYFLNRGASIIDVIGYGCKDGKFQRNKEYTRGSTNTTPTHNMVGNVDVNPNYDWHKEKVWMVNQARVTFI